MHKFLKTAALSATAAAMMVSGGCKKTADNTLNYKSAINGYYDAHPSCIWSSPKKFPVQVDTSDSKTQDYDALFNQGLLNRTTDEKKKLLGLVQKQVTNYDLSDKGRGAWTADKTDASSGNFCYGNRSVSNIDSSTPNTGEVGATTVVNYHWSFNTKADWAKAADVQNAFPAVRTNLAGNGISTKTLVDTSNGWQVQPSSSTTTTPADGSIVE